MHTNPMTTNEFMHSNPTFTYGQSVGYLTGAAAAIRGEKFSGLSSEEWQKATDDYAHGYRAGFIAEKDKARSILARADTKKDK